MSDSESWNGGSGSFSTSGNWSGNAVPSYQQVTVGAGADITLTSSENLTAGLSFTGTGTIEIETASAENLSISDTLVMHAGEMLVLDKVSIHASLFSFSGAGTFEIEGGSLGSSSGFSLASNQTLILNDTTYSTTSDLTGAGTLVLAGTSLNLTGGSAPTEVIQLADVAAGGAGNTLTIPNYYQHLTLSNLGYGDVIKVTNGSAVDNVSLVSIGDGVYSLVDNGTTIATHVTLAADATMSDFNNTGASYTWNGLTPCFYPGTRLSTADGEIAVEDVVAGTMLKTASGDILPVRWVGWSEVATRLADPLKALPIRIKADALADGVPARDLLVSPDHAIFIGGVLVQAGALVNGASILREEDVPESFRYYHVELATHELLLAENCPAESFVDNVDRLNFHNWDVREVPGEPVAEMEFARAKSSRQVPVAVREAIAARAGRAVSRAA